MAGSLDISAVLAVFEPPLYDFLFDLVVDPDCGDPLCDCCPWFQDDGFCFKQADLDACAHRWANDENLPWPDRAALLLQLDKLPWHNGEIVFYWGDSDE